nr:hypothetical protein GCM10020093_082760 [Planobispora longispora]
MDRTTMVAVVDDLERLGHARRERSATDRRKHVVILTAEGAAALTEALRLLAEAQEELLSPLPAAERDQFHDLVSRLFAARAGSDLAGRGGRPVPAEPYTITGDPLTPLYL